MLAKIDTDGYHVRVKGGRAQLANKRAGGVSPAAGDGMLNTQIANFVFSIGVSPRHKGFDYICRVLELMLEGEVYRSACGKLCRELDIDRHSAERCMRYALRCAWDEHPASIRGAYLPISSNERFAPPPAINDFFCVALWRLRESGVKCAAG